MQLFSRHITEDTDAIPLVILHGLFGSSDNWKTLGKKFAKFQDVYLLDLRNHGRSEHSTEHTYKLMSYDIAKFLEDNQITKCILLGHSMGGKVAMRFATDYPDRLSQLIVADIAPKSYEPHHNDIIDVLKLINFEEMNSRREVDDYLTPLIKDVSTRQFLMKSLFWKEKGKLAFRFNLKAIENNLEEISKSYIEDKIGIPTLFLRGEKSNYILDEDIHNIEQQFDEVEVKTISDANHWLHAEQPEQFYNLVMQFILYGN